jgi:hypothetical protein
VGKGGANIGRLLSEPAQNRLPTAWRCVEDDLPVQADNSNGIGNGSWRVL